MKKLKEFGYMLLLIGVVAFFIATPAVAGAVIGLPVLGYAILFSPRKNLTLFK